MLSFIVKKKQKETKNEKVILDHFSHHHPLTLTEFDEKYQQCKGCWESIFLGDTVYMCSQGCLNGPILHEECAEMPREIRLSMHPQHTLIQREEKQYPLTCVACKHHVHSFTYYCNNTSCEFYIHLRCAMNKSVLKSCIDHPSHHHQLTLMWRPGRSCSSRCGACGTMERGNSYTCTECQVWINESCANLPITKNYPHLHHHPLSLVFEMPPELIRFDYFCGICSKDISIPYWLYYCAICRYLVHIQCLINSSSSTTTTMNIDTNAARDKDVIVFPVPVYKVAEQLIEPFVIKVGGKAMLRDNEIVNGKYKFCNHDHELSLISRDDEEEEENGDNDDDDDDEFLPQLRRKSEIVCDGCSTPIFQKNYFSCGECKYVLHRACFHLPQNLTSLPIHPKKYHCLILKNTPKLEIELCKICDTYMNGLFYECTDCDFKADIKCASLPDNIKHLAHPHHHLKLITNTPLFRHGRIYIFFCMACGQWAKGTYYECSICKIFLHTSCASLPAEVTNPTWDMHPLPLTFHPTLDHPTDFYCEICEVEMDPTKWMYHCHSCDFSIHPRCFPTQSGKYRNMKFGKRYVNPAVHHHPLVYQFQTKKLHCNVCKRKTYGDHGFHCASDKCEFFMCYDRCSKNHRDALQEVD